MRIVIIALMLYAGHAAALPVVCESLSKTNDVSILRVKINPKKNIRMNGKVWRLFNLGISAEQRQIMYGSGDLDSRRIRMTVVKNDSVYGYIEARSSYENGIYEGKIRIAGTNKGREIEVQCTDEAVHGVVSP